KSGDRSQIKPKQRRIKAVNQEDGKRLGDFLNERGELGIYAKSASPSPADEKIRLLRAVRYHHLAVARELFVA
ncbi:hypothetical protein, partial [Aeromonas caviae]|uniref:hypothetical protein n=1 Tax=Aeromonas caviae TaxID=648 RepID=UPI001CC7C9F8